MIPSSIAITITTIIILLHLQGPTDVCQYHQCDPNRGCVEGLPAGTDPRCNNRPPNPATPVQDQDCNGWYCVGGNCVWKIKPGAVCDVRDVESNATNDHASKPPRHHVGLQLSSWRPTEGSSMLATTMCSRWKRRWRMSGHSHAHQSCNMPSTNRQRCSRYVG